VKRQRQKSSRLPGDSFPSGKRIRQARELNGLTQFELAAKVGVSQGLIAQIEGSFKAAHPDLIQKIAIQTERFQPSFFYSDPAIAFPPESVMFRAMARTTRKEETEACRYAEIVCEVASLLLKHIKPMEFRLKSATPSDPSEAARRVRLNLGLPSGEPIAHLIREVEKSGVLVLALPMDLPKRDALSLWADELGMPVMALSGGRPGDRVRLTVANELGHIALGHSKLLHSADEDEAFEFGDELLMPESAMRREMIPPITLSVLLTLKARWRVSLSALIRRAKSLGVIDESRATYLYTQISVNHWRKEEPVPIPLERPRLLRQLFERVYGEDYVKLANDVDYRPQFVREILEVYEARQENEPSRPTKVVSLRHR